MSSDFSIGEAEGSGRSILVRGLMASRHFTDGIFVTLILGAIGAAGRVVIPMAIQVATDDGIENPDGVDVQIVAMYATLAGMAALIGALSSAAMNWRLSRRSEEGLAELRVEAFQKVHRLSHLRLQGDQRGALVSRVTADIDAVANFLQDMGLAVITSVMQMLFAIIVISTYSWKLAALVLVGFVPLFILVQSVQQLTKKRFDAVRKSFGTMTSVISETLAGAGIIRTYRIQGSAHDRIDHAVENLKHRQWKGQLTTTRSLIAGELTPGLTTAGIIAVGVVLGTRGQITVGALISVLFLIPLFVTPVQLGVEIINQTQDAIAGWRRVLGLLDTPIDVTGPEASARDTPRKAGALEFQGVTFRYPDGTPALRDISVAIAGATKVAVVGHTGSGKSTFGNLIVRLADPSSGVVTLDGEPLGAIPLQELRRRVALVPQDPFLFDRTIAENVRCGSPGAADDDIRAAFAELGLTDWLATLPAGLGTAVGERGAGLSAGERQLVSLARAHISDPDVLVLDEATSSVDPATEERIRRAMTRLVDGRTALHIAHRLSSAEDADHVLVFHSGRIVEQGSHHSLIQQGGIYQGLHDSWVKNTA
ncbi:ABC transporter ATP-binding protein [Streptomyces sp. NPDC088251]|uniref:ABC transporter ATP-binding protein n=1 Tax=Streptomyces sp. NPDC088251 TaxID=3365844 RepID=UPI003821CC31